MNSSVSLLLSLLSSIGSTYELMPKCWLILSEIYQLQHSSSSESNLTILTFSDGLYDPECECNGLFKAKRCNSTDVCWCIDRAGVRRNIQCEELLVTNWIRVEIKHKVTNISVESSQLQNIIQEHYKMDPELNDTIDIKYDVDARLITMDLRTTSNDKIQDLYGLAFYMKRNLKMKLLSSDQIKPESVVEGEELEIESILVYYMDEKKPTNTTQKLTTIILTVTGVLILTVCVGIVIMFLIRRNKRGKYEKAQTSETEEI
ncbi:epithelial cell adhesion molecule-like [Trichomycterus rosablanca]|uniref:epithelial cell adhesion molecule-like n=1 Tax=Trichomycterus rosablanca TaxID=2290929 RepID=UPI002F35341D